MLYGFGLHFRGCHMIRASWNPFRINRYLCVCDSMATNVSNLHLFVHPWIEIHINMVIQECIFIGYLAKFVLKAPALWCHMTMAAFVYSTTECAENIA